MDTVGKISGLKPVLGSRYCFLTGSGSLKKGAVFKVFYWLWLRLWLHLNRYNGLGSLYMFLPALAPSPSKNSRLPNTDIHMCVYNLFMVSRPPKKILFLLEKTCYFFLGFLFNWGECFCISRCNIRHHTYII